MQLVGMRINMSPCFPTYTSQLLFPIDDSDTASSVSIIVKNISLIRTITITCIQFLRAHKVEKMYRPWLVLVDLGHQAGG